MIVTATNSAALAARQATATIPIVMATSDMLAASLARPGGNVTGVTSLSKTAKQLGLTIPQSLLSRADEVLQ